MSMKNLLTVEIEEKAADLAKLDPGTKEYGAAVDSITKLMDRVIEIEKLESSEAQAEKQMEMSKAQAEKQMKEERIGRLIKNVIDVGSIVLPLAVTVWGAKASFKFEEEGTITTQAGRKFMDKLFNFKK